jgi:hypothetical protein
LRLFARDVTERVKNNVPGRKDHDVMKHGVEANMAERTEQLGGLRAKNAAAGRKKQEERSQ